MPSPAPTPFSTRRLLPLGILLGAGALFLALGGHRHVTPAALAEDREWLCALVGDGAAGALVYVAAYAGLVALSVPGAALLTMTGGFLFGCWLGTAYAVLGATAGAVAVFVAARFGLGGLAERAGPRFRRMETGFRENALWYLLVLRLVPIFPFWLVNLVAGAAGLPLRVYLFGTLFGIIPVTFVYASLGSGLGAVVAEGRGPHPGMLLRPGVLLPLIGLAALALLPVAYKQLRARSRRERV